MKPRTPEQWVEYAASIKCPEGWSYATEHGKYRIFVSKTNTLMFYLYKRRRFLFWTWYSPLFIFQA